MPPSSLFRTLPAARHAMTGRHDTFELSDDSTDTPEESKEAPEGATLATADRDGDAMTVTEERPPDALEPGPGFGIDATEDDPPQPGQYTVYEEFENLEPDDDLSDPDVELETVSGRLYATPVAAAPKAVQATKVVNEARSHLGFREGRNNDNPFWIWPPRYAWLRHASYCASAATYCFWRAGGDAGLKAIYGGHFNCGEWVTTFQKHNRFYHTGQRGDLVFFDWTGRKSSAEHVGIVESVDSHGNVTAVEFNTGSGAAGSQSDGGGCFRRTRNGKWVVGYGRPLYGPETNVHPVPHDPTGKRIVLPVDGVWGVSTNRRLQQWMGLPVDGVCGPSTRKALQRALSVTADGVWGPGTRKALQRMVGVAQDGVWGRTTVRALQRYLNAAPVRRGVRVAVDDTVEPGSGIDLLIALLNAAFERWLTNGGGKHAAIE